MPSTFGAVTDAVEVRIRAASADELTRWTRRILTAETVESLLDG